jgi:hypothetical protein
LHVTIKSCFLNKGDENELFAASVRIDCMLHCSLGNQKKIQENTKPRIDHRIHSICYINCHIYRTGNGPDKKIYKFYSIRLAFAYVVAGCKKIVPDAVHVHILMWLV